MTASRFTIDIDAAVLDDLRSRLRATKWPDDLDNDDWSYGLNAGYLRELVRAWAEEYDWRAAEKTINTFAHYRANVDGVPVHFIREPGQGPHPIPLILSHGWPWTFWDMHKIIRPLADPAAFGGDPRDAFEVIVPSLPGYGFSTPLPRGGMNAFKAADLWHTLMTATLGFERYAAGGGDWGAVISSQLGHKYATSLYGVHLIQTIPLDMFNHERYWDITARFVPNSLPDEIRRPLLAAMKPAVSHVAVQSTDPQTLSYAMHDSPVGLLAWLVQRRRGFNSARAELESVFPREHLLTSAMIFWATGSFVGSARYYADAVRFPWTPSHDRLPVVEAPTGLTFLGGENPPGVRTADRVAMFKASPLAGYYNLHFANAHEAGGHFGHYENPQACIDDIRATFRSLR